MNPKSKSCKHALRIQYIKVLTAIILHEQVNNESWEANRNWDMTSLLICYYESWIKIITKKDLFVANEKPKHSLYSIVPSCNTFYIAEYHFQAQQVYKLPLQCLCTINHQQPWAMQNESSTKQANTEIHIKQQTSFSFLKYRKGCVRDTGCLQLNQPTKNKAHIEKTTLKD